MKMAGWVRGAVVFCWVLLVLPPCAALAQVLGKTVVVTLGAEREPALAAAQQVEAQLAERRVSLISMHDARDRFTQRSRPAQHPSETDLESLAKQAAQAVEHVAFGRAQAAERSVQNIIALAERSLETLNRETGRARQLLDACLALVRSSLHEGQRDLAIEQAMECRRLVPDLSPNESSHPGSVIGALAEADDRLRRMHAGNLTVRAMPSQVCSLYLNGRHLGTTPFVTDRAAAGVYRVQVECAEGQASRVHLVRLGDQATALEIDVAFDRAVVTEPRLGLIYPGNERRSTLLVAHALRLGSELRADDVIIVGVHRGRAEVLRVSVPLRRVAAAAVGTFDATSGLRVWAGTPLLDALTQGRFLGLGREQFMAEQSAEAKDTAPPAAPPDAAVAQSARAAEPELAPQRRHGGRSSWMAWTGGITLAIGLGGEVAAWLLFRDRAAQGEELLAEPTDDDTARASWERVRAPMLSFGAAGAGLASAGVTLLVLAEPKPKVPWWLAGIAGGAGAALGTWAVVDVAKGEACDDSDDVRACLVSEQQRDRGALLLTSAIPLLLFPIVKALRSGSVHVAATLRGVHVHGSW